MPWILLTDHFSTLFLGVGQKKKHFLHRSVFIWQPSKGFMQIGCQLFPEISDNWSDLLSFNSFITSMYIRARTGWYFRTCRYSTEPSGFSSRLLFMCFDVHVNLGNYSFARPTLCEFAAGNHGNPEHPSSMGKHICRTRRPNGLPEGDVKRLTGHRGRVSQERTDCTRLDTDTEVYGRQAAQTQADTHGWTVQLY